MKRPPSNRDLLRYLKSVSFQAGLLDRLKVYYRPITCPFVELIRQVKSGEKVGDIGCGSGQFCLLLAEFADPSYVLGIEISDRLVNNATALLSRHAKIAFDVERYDGIHFPERIQTLDVVFLNDVLHHVARADQRRFMADLAAAVGAGAKLIVKDIDGSSLLRYCNKVHDLLFAGEIGNELPCETVQSWLRQNGLEITEVQIKRMYVYPHYTIVARKP